MFRPPMHKRIRTLTCAALIAPAAIVAATAPARAATQQISVNLGSTTGAVYHGASGALYGLARDGVPGLPLLAPLHVRTIAQKPPNGAQHPGGDADKDAPTRPAASTWATSATAPPTR